MNFFLSIFLFILLTSCSDSNHAGGGGADIGNPIMVGVALTSEHEGAAGVEIYLIPSDYIARESHVDPRYRTITDENGKYSFEITQGVSYTLSAQAVTDNENYSLFRRGITSDDSAVIYDVFQKSVDLTLRIPQELTGANTILSMPGIPAPLSYKQEDFQGVSAWVIENLPQGNIAEIYMWNSNETEQLTDSLVLGSDSMQVADTYTEWITFTKDNSAINQDSIYEVFRDSRGVDWFGTVNGLYRGDNWELFDLSDGLQSSMILALEEDQNGAIWCGTALGVSLIEGPTVTAFIDPEAPKSGVYDIFIDDNRIWFGTDEGLYLYDQGVWSQFATSNSGLSNDLIYSITKHENRLHLGTFGGGVSIFDGTNWDTLTQENSGLESNHIYVVESDDQGQLWCGTGNGISQKNGNSWTNINRGNSDLPDNTIWSLAVDSEGVWAGTGAGTIRYEKGYIQIFREDNSRFDSPQSFTIYVDPKSDAILFGTGAGAVIKTKF